MSLSLMPLAIGSLPYSSVEYSLNYIFEHFKDTPFWPQLAKIDRHEDMIVQYTQNVPGIVYDSENLKYICSQNSDDFFEKLEYNSSKTSFSLNF